MLKKYSCNLFLFLRVYDIIKIWKVPSVCGESFPGSGKHAFVHTNLKAGDDCMNVKIVGRKVNLRDNFKNLVSKKLPVLKGFLTRMRTQP